MEVPLPDNLRRRIPTGHVLHRHTGTVEVSSKNNVNGQCNFFLHPIPGEENASLRPTSGPKIVTDLPIDQAQGQRIWLFSFVSDEGKISPFLSWSRSTGDWITLQNEQVMIHLFRHKPASTGKKLMFLGLAALGGTKMADQYARNEIERTSLNGPETLRLILDIRSYLESSMAEPPSQSPRLQ